MGLICNIGRDTAKIRRAHCPTGNECSPSQAPASEALPPGSRMPTELQARTQAFDGQRIFTRAARKRKAQVCGEVTVGGEGQGNNKVRRPGWHLIHRKRSPLPSLGEGISAVERWARLRMSGVPGYRRPHPPHAVPLPLKGKDNAPLPMGRDCECRAQLTTDHCPLFRHPSNKKDACYGVFFQRRERDSNPR